MSISFDKTNGKRGITEVTVSVTPVDIDSSITERAEDYDWEKEFAAIGIRTGVDREARFTIEQKVYPYLSPNPLYLDKEGGNGRLYIQVDSVFGEWEVLSWPDWIHLTSQRWGFGSWYVDFRYDPSDEVRVGIIEVASTTIRKAYAVQGSLEDFTLSYVSRSKVKLENLEWDADIVNHYKGEEVKVDELTYYRWYVEFSNEVRKIPEGAFKNANIYDVSLPNTIQVIGKEAFYGTHLTSINFPDSVRVIEDYAFHNISNNVGLGETLDLNNVYSIGRYAFSNNDNIKYVIMNSVIELGDKWLSTNRSVMSQIMSIREIQKSGIDANLKFTINTFFFNNTKIVGGTHKIICPSNSDYTEWLTRINEYSEYNGYFVQEKTLPAVEVSFSRNLPRIPSKGGTMVITANKNDFEAEVLKGEGLVLTKNGNNLSVTCDSTSLTQREWVIGFFIEGRWYMQSVSQYPASDLAVSPEILNISAKGGLDNIAYFDISSDTNWVITTEDTWFSIGGSGDEHPERGSGNARRSLICEAYTGETQREGYLTISTEWGEESVILTIVQTAKEPEPVIDEPFYFQTNGTSYFSWNRQYEENDLEYSFNGETWETLSPETQITFGGKVYLRGDNDQIGKYYMTKPVFVLGGDNVSVGGNILYLLSKDGVKTSALYNCFSNLFYENTALVDAENLIMPSIKIPFEGCYEMFRGCTNLVNPPKKLPSMELGSNAYDSMFRGCTSLASTPELPALTLEEYCYNSMFEDCTSLTTIPLLPALTLMKACYRYMFYGCTGLTGDMGKLNATELADSCYYSMFSGCKNITSIEINGNVNKSKCCEYMFNNCSKLKTVKLNSSTPLGTSYSSNWMNGVPYSGTFYKKAGVNHPRNVSGIPYGWEVVDI